MSDIVLASGNQGKIAELNELLSPHGFNIVSQSAFNTPEAEENGLSFVENALIKARNACKYSQLPAIADDSGLAVDYLKGQPGIYSARYAGINASDEDNNKKLLNALIEVPKEKRTASFHCAIAFMQHENDPTPIIVQAQWQGTILENPTGDGGFGYDPLFLIDELNKTSAQLEKHHKNRISHRGQAIAKLIVELKQHGIIG